MKKIIMLAMVVFTSSLLFYASVLAVAIGDLDENLRIDEGSGCIRPLLILSDNDKVNVYITGAMVNSATILSQKRIRSLARATGRQQTAVNAPDLLYIEGGLYFDFKDENVREKTVGRIKEMFRVHEENLRLNRETGKEIPSPESKSSYFWGSLKTPGQYMWGRSCQDPSRGGKPAASKQLVIDDFRFLAMQVRITLSFSPEDFTYDVGTTKVSVDGRSFHSAQSMPMCFNDNEKSHVGIVSTPWNMRPNGCQGQILAITRPDGNIMDYPDMRPFFEPIIKNILGQILKTKKSLPMRE